MKSVFSIFAIMMTLMISGSPGIKKAAEPNAKAFSEETVEMETLTFRGKTYYLVFSEEQLRAVAAGQFGWDKNYMQQADIQLSSKEWQPIGTMEQPFTGSYNGNGYEINGLTMADSHAELVGLFGYAKDAHLYNIILRDVDIDRAGTDGECKKDAVCALAKDCRIYDNHVYNK
ncbi:MAG: hypothetical protein K2N87_06375 [Eubacterium sp.]|nr:hypothetical protein [Eubacterium sp.]